MDLVIIRGVRGNNSHTDNLWDEIKWQKTGPAKKNNKTSFLTDWQLFVR